MVDPKQKPNREGRLAEVGAMASSASDANSQSARTMAGDAINLERLGRRRQQKKFFIAKARGDVA